MNVVHVLLAGASRYDRVCTTIDLSIGSGTRHVLFEAASDGWLQDGESVPHGRLTEILRSDTSLLHLHGATQPPRRLLAGLSIPWVCDRQVALPRSLFRRIPRPAAILIERPVPEVASDDWFIDVNHHSGRQARRRVGCYIRNEATRNHAEQVAGRIQRFRDDVEWVLHESPPTPDEVAALDVWLDPATGEADVDGMVVEALACLTTVVAARTELNDRRLEGGKAGLLPPVGDHNEMTHSVLNALFKDEVSAALLTHNRAVRNRLRPANRRTAVERVYLEVAGERA